MKKIPGFFLSWIVFSCNTQQPQNQTTLPDTASKIQADTIATKIPEDTVLLHLAKKILQTIKQRDFVALAAFTGTKGSILFSPYAHLDTAHNQVLNKSSLLTLSGNNKKLNWGSYDGSGLPINLSLTDYFKKFVYDADFLQAEKFSVDERIGSGNSLHNVSAIYPGSHFVEAHFTGFDKQYEGMDWKSLRLVFMPEANGYKLVAVVHDQWTI